MTQALILVGIVAGIGLLVWAAQSAARRRGAAEAKLDAERTAREVEQDMTDEVMKPRSPEETRRKLDEGTF